MANKIKLRRGNKATLPTLDEGELAFVKDEKSLYVGTSSGNKSITTDAQPKIVTGTVETAASTVAKVLTITGYTPAVNDLIAVTFTSGNTANAATLNINGGGAKNIKLGGGNPTGASGTGAFYLTANSVVLLMVTETGYHLMGSQDITDSSGYDMATQAEAEAGENLTKVMSPSRTKQAIAAQVPEWSRQPTKPSYTYSDIGGTKPSYTYSDIGGTKPPTDAQKNPTIATEAEAEAGTDNTKMMTPLRTKEAIEAAVSAEGGITDAPNDGKLYGRQNQDWEEIINGGGVMVVDTPIAELNNKTLREVFEDGNQYAGGASVASGRGEIVSQDTNSIVVKTVAGYTDIIALNVVGSSVLPYINITVRTSSGIGSINPSVQFFQGALLQSLSVLDEVAPGMSSPGYVKASGNMGVFASPYSVGLQFNFSTGAIRTITIEDIYIISRNTLGLDDVGVSTLNYWFNVWLLYKDREDEFGLINTFELRRLLVEKFELTKLDNAVFKKENLVPTVTILNQNSNTQAPTVKGMKDFVEDKIENAITEALGDDY